MTDDFCKYKKKWKNKYLKWICALANARGGTLALGFGKGGTPVGLADAEAIAEALPSRIRESMGIAARVEIRDMEGRQCLVVTVPFSAVPVSLDGAYYLYRKGKCRELEGSRLKKFLRKRRSLTWDARPLPSFGPDDVDETSVTYFRKRGKENARLENSLLEADTEELLRGLHLTSDGCFTNAAMLLFARDPERWVSGAYVQIGILRGSQTIYKGAPTIRGSLFRQIDDAVPMLMGLMAGMGFHSTRPFIVPQEAVHEAVSNALCHRDYDSAADDPVLIHVGTDSLTISNCCRLPLDWIDNLGKSPANAPNPDIARLFYQAGHAELQGSGIGKIRTACRAAGLPEPTYTLLNGRLTIRFEALRHWRHQPTFDTLPGEEAKPKDQPKQGQAVRPEPDMSATAVPDTGADAERLPEPAVSAEPVQEAAEVAGAHPDPAVPETGACATDKEGEMAGEAVPQAAGETDPLPEPADEPEETPGEEAEGGPVPADQEAAPEAADDVSCREAEPETVPTEDGAPAEGAADDVSCREAETETAPIEDGAPAEGAADDDSCREAGPETVPTEDGTAADDASCREAETETAPTEDGVPAQGAADDDSCREAETETVPTEDGAPAEGAADDASCREAETETAPTEDAALTEGAAADDVSCREAETETAPTEDAAPAEGAADDDSCREAETETAPTEDAAPAEGAADDVSCREAETETAPTEDAAPAEGTADDVSCREAGPETVPTEDGALAEGAADDDSCREAETETAPTEDGALAEGAADDAPCRACAEGDPADGAAVRDASRLTVNGRKVLACLAEHPEASMTQLAARIGINRKTVAVCLKHLKDDRFIVRVGTSRKGFWKLLCPMPDSI